MLSKIKQYVPSLYCLKCDVCCRFIEADSPWRPVFTGEETNKLVRLKKAPASIFSKDEGIVLKSQKEFHICPFFETRDNKCDIYKLRPFDCQFYPFILTCAEDNMVFLGADKKCPFVIETFNTQDFNKYAQYLTDYFSSEKIVGFINDNPELISSVKDDIVFIAKLDLAPAIKGLKRLELADKPIIDKYLSLGKHRLSNFSFASIFVWSGLFDIFWQVIDDNLCVFFKDKIGCFMYLPPMGKKITPKTLDKVFKIMDAANKNKAVSRIENAEEDDLKFYKASGFNCRLKDREYIYKAKDLIKLSGNKYKSKRPGYNYFMNNIRHKYQPFNPGMKDECLRFYQEWMLNRKGKYSDPIYRYMLEDSLSVNEIAMTYFEQLGLEGRAVTIDDKIRAYTFGYRLSEETFCILIEIADINIKGLAQFIFQRFCAELNGVTYINTLDDSGLANLRKVKLSYHPIKFEPSYIVSRE